MITERLMEQGSWALTLRDETPWEVRQQIYRGDQIVVFPVRRPDAGLSAAQLLSSSGSIYRGVVTGHSQDRSEFSGANLLWLISSASKIGRVVTYAAGYWFKTTFHGHILGFTTAELAALAWNVAGPGAPTEYPNTYEEWQQMPLNVLDRIRHIASMTGTSWRYDGNGGFVYGAHDDPLLHAGFGTTLPTVLISDTGHGQDIDVYGLAHDADGDLDIEDFIDRAIVAAPGGLWGVHNRAGAPYIPDNSGTPRYRTMVDMAEAPSTADAEAKAVSMVVEHGQRSYLEVGVHTPTVRTMVTPGDRIGVYLPRLGYMSTGETFTYLGRQIAPARVQVVAMTWPVEPTMSVYTFDRANRRPPVDLTPWVIHETGPAIFEMGAPAKWLQLPLRSTTSRWSGIPLV